MRGHRSWALGLLDWYQRALDGRPSPCRFTPSCSSYARDALEVHGTGRGLWLTVRRLVRCRPFGPSGFDPVALPSVRTTPADDGALAINADLDVYTARKDG